MLTEEFQEVGLRTVFVFVNMANQSLSEKQGVSECCVNRAESSQEHQQEAEECRAFSSRIVESVQKVFNIDLKLLYEIESELIGHLVNLVEEGVDHVIFDLELVELSSVLGVLSNEVGNLIMEDVSDSFRAGSAHVAVRLVVLAFSTEARVDVACRRGLSLLTRTRHLGVHHLSLIVC